MLADRHSLEAARQPRALRWWRHWRAEGLGPRRAFSRAAIAAIEAAIRDGEARHRAELRFVFESRLPGAALRRRVAARERALALFASLGMAQTRERTAVLLYVLWADRAIEIVVDEGAHAALPDETLRPVVASLARAYREGRWAGGTVAAVHALHALAARGLPARAGDNPDELPAAPVVR